MATCSYCTKDKTENKIIVNTWHGTVRKDVTFYYCCEDCKHHIEEYAKALNKQVKQFLYLILTVVMTFILLPAVTALLKDQTLIFIAFGVPAFLLGIVLFKYPFATPESNSKWGIKKSIKVLKSFGITLMFIGILLQFINLVTIIR
jgi:hypothetical protein